MSQPYPKRLIEVELPIKRISAHARREKAIRHGHISTLHIWWARRPLAACRAVICAALWLDPVDPSCPQDFRNKASQLISAFARAVTTDRKLGETCDHDTWRKWQGVTKQGGLDAQDESHWNSLRSALLDFIADFANWDNSTTKECLDTSQGITQAAYEALGGDPGSRPLVLDPFAGGGSIPLEALRIGADAFASDLNPIPVLLNKVTVESIPQYGTQLADAVREWGTWMKEEAKSQLGDLYRQNSSDNTPVAFLWARTVLSEAPSTNDLPVQVPLLRSLWLSKRTANLRALRWVRDQSGEMKTSIQEIEYSGSRKQVRVPMLEIFTPATLSDVEAGSARGGAAICPVTGFTTSTARVKEQLKTQRGGADHARLYAVYEDGDHGREFRLSTDADLRAFAAGSERAQRLLAENPDAFPRERINPIRPYKNTRGLSCRGRDDHC